MKTIYFSELLGQIKKENGVSDVSYSVWLKTIQLEDWLEEEIRLSSPFEASAHYVNKRFGKEIERVFKKGFDQECTVKITPRNGCGDGREKIILKKSIGSEFKNPVICIDMNYLVLCEKDETDNQEKWPVKFQSDRVFSVPKGFDFFVNTENEFILVEIIGEQKCYVISPQTKDAHLWTHAFFSGMEYEACGEVIRVVEERI